MIELPLELMIEGRKIKLAVDIVYINGEAFLHSVDQSIKYNGIVSLGTKYTAAKICKALDNILRLYNKAGIYVTVIHADNEFRKIFRDIDEDWEVESNFSLPQEHVPDIEHENRVLQERFRVRLYILPYTKLPKAMIQYLALRVTRNRSYFPKKTGISKVFLPHNFKGKVS